MARGQPSRTPSRPTTRTSIFTPNACTSPYCATPSAVLLHFSYLFSPTPATTHSRPAPVVITLPSLSYHLSTFPSFRRVKKSTRHGSRSSPQTPSLRTARVLSNRHRRPLAPCRLCRRAAPDPGRGSRHGVLPIRTYPVVAFRLHFGLGRYLLRHLLSRTRRLHGRLGYSHR